MTLMLRDGSALHISTQEYYTPLGNSLAGVGLTPDQIILLSEEKREEFTYGLLERDEDDQLIAAREAVHEKKGN